MRAESGRTREEDVAVDAVLQVAEHQRVQNDRDELAVRRRRRPPAYVVHGFDQREHRHGQRRDQMQHTHGHQEGRGQTAAPGPAHRAPRPTGRSRPLPTPARRPVRSSSGSLGGEQRALRDQQVLLRALVLVRVQLRERRQRRIASRTRMRCLQDRERRRRLV